MGVPASHLVPLVAESAETTPIGGRFEAWLRFNDSYEDAPAPTGARSLKAEGAWRSAQPVASVSAGFSEVLDRYISSTSSTGSRESFARGTHSSATHSRERADVVIVGGGIMGLNIAYQMRRRDPNMSVLILERAPALGFGSSGYSTGFQRAYYSFDETMSFALDGMAAYKNWTDYLRDDTAAAKFTETGALWMLGHDRCQNDAMVSRLKRFGVAADRLDEAEMNRRFPLISTDPFPSFNEAGEEVSVDYGSFSAVFEHGCGHIDSSTCLEDLLRACRRDGAEVRMNTRVQAFTANSDCSKCTGVQLEDGSVIEAGVAVINAAGPWFNKLNETVGVNLSTTALPTRIQVGHKWVPDEYCTLPFVADSWGPSGIYFMPRAANNQLVFGSVAHRFESEIVDPDNYNNTLDPDVKQDYLNCLFHRLPGLSRDGEIVGFSSMYTVNQDDVHPMIGETKVRGLWACNGFSGHGFKLAPAVGSLVAQQVTGLKTDHWETTVPFDFMGPYREKLTLKVKTHFA